ncbi:MULTISPECIES: iron-siderophore ABC transporter substrate-binding protein [unclassified Tolypothrix]|uniref:iron-siderophore ABC transporter substrate-binding protein n=1 Tax=unclassified Tolypothrix TaxID=2649714 RepID=UPI0005EAC1E0|nr:MULTISPECIES: iron-siderophore ABC transporter substrate-binding protein [unclassified Tolypothrix]BAY91128.1 ABC transporter, iron(III) dicitrate-binding periplasmic protein [Microchaete diplosiphon NIES-3275]EKE99944.1 periplasmic binding protein [Tolypothrix sp. PCC 7601]MBE9081426.1 iron-siderophore ABC transporter substrate-binding protein [Tolypothrix sp. LEGE 11397]UYD25223.1 iron-siderophore ABC transporter substrate-binding protein [Tolypothrix sp. PCC 7712]UYD32538.1 iron-sideroph
MNRFLYRLTSVLCLVITIFTLVCACSKSVSDEVATSQSPQPSLECRVVEHARGETCIPLNPQRIVTLDFNSFAAILALDIKPIATWITTEIEDDFPYFQGKADGVEILRSSSSQINLEKLVLLHPDLIIVISHPGFAGIYKYVSQIAPTVILPWVETQGNWKQHIQDTAKIFNKTETGIQLINYYNQRVNQLKQTVGNNHQKNRISFAYVAAGRLVITRQKSFAGGILHDIGVLNPIFAESGDNDLPLSEELLPKIDSDILFIAPLQKDDYSVIQQLQQKPLWFKIKAVQQNQVYLVDFSVWRGLNILAAYAMLDDLDQYIVNIT